MESHEITEFLTRGAGNVQVVRRDFPRDTPQFQVLAADTRGILVKSVNGPELTIFYPWSEILEVRERK